MQRAVHLPTSAPLVGVLNKGVEGEEWGAPFLAKLAGMSGTESPDDIMREAPDKVGALFEHIAKAPVHRGIQLVSTRADLPVRTSDIGVWISQLLPVVVAVIDPDRPGITAIEQPELHVHPRLQVELGDLFAESVAGGNVFLIETHSEHLLLRIMRRMRETSAGTLPEGAPEVRPEDVNVLFVEPDGAQTLIRAVPAPRIEIHRVCYDGSGPARRLPMREDPMYFQRRFRDALARPLGGAGMHAEVFIWRDFHDRLRDQQPGRDFAAERSRRLRGVRRLYDMEPPRTRHPRRTPARVRPGCPVGRAGGPFRRPNVAVCRPGDGEQASRRRG